MQINTTTRRTRVNVEAARRNCPRNDARLDGQDALERQVFESLRFMDYQAQGLSWSESMKLARADASVKFQAA